GPAHRDANGLSGSGSRERCPGGRPDGEGKRNARGTAAGSAVANRSNASPADNPRRSTHPPGPLAQRAHRDRTVPSQGPHKPRLQDSRTTADALKGAALRLVSLGLETEALAAVRHPL